MFKEFKKHVMTGISFLIPMVVMAGILGAIQKAYSWSGVEITPETISGLSYSGFNIFDIEDWMYVFGKLNSEGFNWAYAFLAAGIAYSVADRPGIVPGFAVGYYAGGPTKCGFIGAMVVGLGVGYLVKWMKTWKVPKWMSGLMPVLIIPVLATAVCAILFFGILQRPIAQLMILFQNWIMSLSDGSKFIVGAIIGACMGFDMGGPINKTASMAANAIYADYSSLATSALEAGDTALAQEYSNLGGSFESAKIIGGMTPGIGVGLAAIIAPKKFTQEQKNTAYTAIPMGFCFITEGVLPFAADDPLRFIPSSMIGSAIAGGIAMQFTVGTQASHGGIFVMPTSNKPVVWCIALAVGSVITGVLYAILKRQPEEEDTEEEIVDLDIDL